MIYTIINALPAILWRNRIEIEFALSRYGFGYLNGIPDCIYARQTSPIFNIKRKYSPCQFINYWFGHTGQMTLQKYGSGER